MIDPMIASQMWKQIVEYTNKIQDKILRESILAVYQQRAIAEWGYCPDKTEYKKQEVKIEDPLVLEYMDKIKDCIEYGVFVKDEQVEKESVARMRDYIRRGGKYGDLPRDLQNETIKNLYLEAMIKEIDEIGEEIKNLS